MSSKGHTGPEGPSSKLMVVGENASHIFRKLTWALRLPRGDGFVRIPASKIGEYLKECYARRR